MRGGLKKKNVGAGEDEGGDPFEERGEEEEGEEEEDEEDEEEETDDEADADFDARQEEEEDTERPKLDEGFYEIEAVRRKRVRKGQVQYLIKWRGWPETANTWEPFENLLSCSDVIDAFEASLPSGKHRSYRKRKRKHGVTYTQPRKKQNTQQHSSYSSRRAEDNIDDELLTSVPIKSSIPVHLPREVNLAVNRPEAVEHGSADKFQQSMDKIEEPEYDPKLSELMGSVRVNGADPENCAKKPQTSEGNGVANGVQNSESVDLNRRIGAKRRKSGSVKRFKQEVASTEVDVENVDCGAQELGTENCKTVGVNSIFSKSDSSKETPVVTKIIKPIGFSSSATSTDQSVSVTFMVVRSDGIEEVVDNSYLKANNPLLLIDFYEQHLRYNPTPS